MLAERDVAVSIDIDITPAEEKSQTKLNERQNRTEYGENQVEFVVSEQKIFDTLYKRRIRYCQIAQHFPPSSLKSLVPRTTPVR
jgi:hypothetical protein